MIKNLLIASGIIVVLAIGGVAVADTNKFLGVLSGKCSYTEDGHWIDQKTGEVYAYGTMEDAKGCAFFGLLPQSVLDRLGYLGTDEDKEIADGIRMLDKSVKDASKK
tara:strand:- start:2544 stop:2864 length:321 start_codon:yes stop_codon:yes gene_type:complete